MGHHQEMIALLTESLDALDLTADQKITVDAIKADLAKHGEVAKEPREKLEADVNDGVSAGKIDHAKTDADIKAMSAAVAATEPAMQDDMNRLHKALTPDQRKKFVETMREKGKAMHEGMGHEGMGHDHPSVELKDKGGSGPADHAKEHENKGAGHMEHEGPPGMGMEGILGKLTEDLGLTPEQKDKLRAKLDPQLKSQHAAMKDKMMAGMKHMDAISTAFETDKFDAKKAGVGTLAPDMLKAVATAKVQFVETVLSVLTPDQRPKLVAHIKAQEAMMMD
jgi:Spy/CpxP family protein refolding chaperone